MWPVCVCACVCASFCDGSEHYEFNKTGTYGFYKWFGVRRPPRNYAAHTCSHILKGYCLKICYSRVTVGGACVCVDRKAELYLRAGSNATGDAAAAGEMDGRVRIVYPAHLEYCAIRRVRGTCPPPPASPNTQTHEIALPQHAFSYIWMIEAFHLWWQVQMKYTSEIWIIHIKLNRYLDLEQDNI